MWINPDCGLETRGNAEDLAEALENLVAAAKDIARQKLDKVAEITELPLDGGLGFIMKSACIPRCSPLGSAFPEAQRACQHHLRHPRRTRRAEPPTSSP